MIPDDGNGPGRSESTDRSSEDRFAVVITVLFLAVAGSSAWHHEMWRDEMQAWLLARDSAGLLDLARHMKYEGHGLLWQICLMPLTRVTPSPLVMQAFHVLIASITVYLVAEYSPFSRFQKTLFAFSYYAVYEYAVLARNYALGAMLLGVLCVFFSRRYHHFIWTGVVVGLLAHTSAVGTIVAIAIWCGLCVEVVAFRADILDDDVIEWRVWTGLGLIAVAVVASVLQLSPPLDSGIYVGWRFHIDPQRMKHVGAFLGKAFLPIPRFEKHFWGSHWLDDIPGFGAVELVVSLLIVGWCCLGLLRRPVALVMFTIGTGGLLSFFYLKGVGGVRHIGFLWLVFLAVAWTSRYGKALHGNQLTRRLEHVYFKSLPTVLTVVLIGQVAGGLLATVLEHRFVFSNGMAAASFLRDRGLQDVAMVGEIDYTASTVLGYLGRRTMYYPRGNRVGSFVVWDQARLVGVSDDAILEKVAAIEQERGSVVLVLNHPLGRDRAAAYALTELASFTGSAVSDEDYWLYKGGTDAKSGE